MKAPWLSVFSITNGRSTHAYSLQSVNTANPLERYPLVILKDMKWIDALNHCLDLCTTPYFLRLDDDFILHPKALKYFECTIAKHHCRRIGFYYWMVWDIAKGVIRRSVKAYSTKSLKSIGGFQADAKTGRVDRVTNPLLYKKGYTCWADSSVVAVHACGSPEEQQAYARKWGRSASELALENSPTLDTQAKMSGFFLEEINRQKETEFHKFLCSGKDD